jgi:predicted RNA methylase
MIALLVSFLVLLILIISVSWTNFKGAPWVPTPLGVVNDMLQLADVKENELVYDLGCGDGRIIVTAALRYRARAVGIELDPLRYLWCQLLITVFGLRGRVTVHLGDFFNHDLSQADVVTCYLLPETNKRLEEKLLKELKPETRVVSNTFLFHQVQPVKQDRKVRLYHFSTDHTLAEQIKSKVTKSGR